MKMLSAVFRAVAFGAAFCCALAVQAATDVYVSPSGNDSTGDGTSAKPYATIAKGVSECDAGGTVHVAAGTYALAATIVLDKAITVQGAGAGSTFVDGGTVYTYNANGTIKSANFGVRVFKITAAATVDGFTIRNGSNSDSDHGGGVYMTAGTLSNCAIRDCIARNNRGGGGVSATSGAVTIRNCEITGCSTWQDGGQGAGVYMDTASGVIENCLIARNFHYANSKTNKAGCGLRLKNGTGRRLTIVDNNFVPGSKATQPEAGGAYLEGGGKLYDSIVWGNGCSECYTATLPDFDKTDSPTVQNVFSGVAIGTSTADHPLAGNPGFVDFDGGDYRLASGSPCIGVASLVSGGDLGYKPYSAADGKLGVSISQYGPMSGSQTLTLTASAGDAAVSGVYWTFDGREPTAGDNDATGAEVQHTFAPGLHTIRAVATVGGAAQSITLKDAVKITSSEVTVGPDMDIYEAVACCEAGGTVSVPEGLYSPITKEVILLNGITVKGTGDREKTIFKGDKASSRIFNVRNSGAILENVTVTGGKANHYIIYGGGVFVTAGTVRDCVITNNVGGGNGGGCGVAMTGGLVTRCLIADNYNVNNVGNGGGVFIEGPSAILDNCLVTRNYTTDSVAKYGGGVCVGWSKTKLGGTSGGTVRSCTIVNNRFPCAGGIYFGAKANIIDTIVWGNTISSSDGATGEPNWVAEATGYKATNVFSAVSLGVNSAGEPMAFGDPLFENFEAGNYQLTSGPCVDSAWREPAADELDYAHAPRKSGTRMDLGCYEKDQTQLSFAMEYKLDGLMAPTKVQLTMTVTPPETDVSTAACYWTLDGREPTESDYDFTGQSVYETIGAGTRSIGMAVKFNNKWYRRTYADLFTIASPKLFVKQENAAAAAPYDTWETAATNLNEVMYLVGDGTVITVTNGVYRLTGQIDILAGAAATLKSVEGPTKTTLEGNAAQDTSVGRKGGTFCILNVQNDNALVDGFTLKDGGSFDKGGCLYLGGGTVQNCILTNGWSRGDKGGGGAYVCRGTLKDSLIVDCAISSYAGRGAGLWAEGENALVDRCVVTKCCDLSSNENDRYGAVYITDHAVVRNTLICNNRIKGYAGVFLGPLATDSGTNIRYGKLVNCTVVSNASYDAQMKGFGGGVYAEVNTTVRNCVIRDNVTANPDVSEVNVNTAGTGSYDHCAVPVAVGTDSVTDDPGFVDAENGNWHLKTRSPCRNRGLNEAWMSTATDLDGKARLFARRVDIGCYENDTPVGLTILVR